MNRIGADSTRSPPAKGAAEVPGLRIGASVVLRALRPGTNGGWVVVVNGVRITASISGPLVAGARYSARVDRLPDRAGWSFRILGKAPDGQTMVLPRSPGLPGDPLGALAARVLMAESLPLDPKNLSRLRGSLGKGGSEGRAALLARSLAKGLDPEAMADALESLESRPDTEDGWNGAPGGGGEGNGNEYPGNDGNPGHGKAASGSGDTAAAEEESGGAARGGNPGTWKEFSRFPETEDDIRNLAGLLRFLASRCSGEPNPFQLFNSRSGPKGRWIYVPYRFEREGVAFSGTLRILIPEGARQADTVSADVLCEDEDGKRGRYAFAFRREGGGYNLSFSAEDGGDGGILSRNLTSFRRELENCGCSVKRVSGKEPDGPVSEYEPVDDHA